MQLPLSLHSKNVSSKGEQLVCYLNRSIYGLKQPLHSGSPNFPLHFCKFTQSKNDYSLFHLGFGSAIVVLLVYVDDIILAGADLDAISLIKTLLHSLFKLKDLRNLKYFLGLEIMRSTKGIYLSQ